MSNKGNINNFFTPKFFIILVLFGCAVACRAAPIKKTDITINHNLGAIKALDKTQVIIHMRPEDRKNVGTAPAIGRWAHCRS